MATLRELKGRIGSVASSEKITGAMKMISSAKMHRAEADLKRLLPFRRQIQTIIGNLLSSDAEFSSPLTQVRDVKKAGIVVLGSDDGLCGGYNINIFKGLIQKITSLRNTYGTDLQIVLIPVGRKMVKACGKLEGDGITCRPAQGVTSKSGGAEVKRFCTELQQQFVGGELDHVELLYMNFQTVSRQRLRADAYLPLDASALNTDGVKALCRPCIFEPDAPTIFRSVIPMFLLSTLQEVFTENRASEQAARIMAMQSANDNAKNLLEQLQLEYNKLRQQGITNELLDILGGQVNN
ncbi:MAG: ATP synthase F1 subunit gamma [Muribaculaceae bacterium]|nr:ATP synthase F1 subunit gamma [Muribaculaceae bacterium]